MDTLPLELLAQTGDGFLWRIMRTQAKIKYVDLWLAWSMRLRLGNTPLLTAAATASVRLSWSN